jgi:hypothetical protein
VSIELQFPMEELRILKLLFSDGLADARQMRDHQVFELMTGLERRMEQMAADTPALFTAAEVQLIAKAVDLGRDKEETLIHDLQIAPEMAAIDRVLAALVIAPDD